MSLQYQFGIALMVMNLILTGLVFVRFYRLSLHHRFPVFCAFLGFAVLRGGVLLAIVQQRRLYQDVWAYTEMIQLIFFVLVTWEVYSVALARYPGIRTLGRRMLGVALAGGLLFALATAHPAIEGGRKGGDQLALLLMVERTVISGLAMVIVIMSGFLLLYPMVLSRNAIIHSVLFAGFFFSKALAVLVRTRLAASQLQAYSMAVMVLATICLSGWILLMRRETDDREGRFGARWNSEEEHKLMRQLESLNSTLSGVSRE